MRGVVFATLKVSRCSLLMLICLGAGLPVSAQNPPIPLPSAHSPPATTPDNTHPFSSDREYDRLIREIELSIPQRNWPIIAERLMDLQKVHPGTLARWRNVVGSVPRIASRLITLLPAEGQQVYHRLAQQASSEKLQSAIQRSDVQAIEQVARQYRQTPAGQEALTLLLKIRIDLGEWQEAALLLEGHFQKAPQFAEQRRTAVLNRNLSTTDSPPPNALMEHFPSLLAAWEVPATVPAKTIDTFNRTARELRESGQSPYPTYSLTPTPNGVVVCGPAERIALDAQTGQVLWRRPVPGYMTEWMLHPGELGNGPRLRMFTFSVANSVFDNSVLTRTQTDGARLFFVESIPVDDPAAKPVDPGKEPFPATRIVCAEARTGKTEWMYHGEPGGAMAFSGPPAVFGNRLFALSRTSGGVVVLTTLDAVTGRPLQSMELSTLHSSLSQQSAFSGHAATMEIHHGQLICATASGTILSIDPVFGEIEWAVQLPRVMEIAPRQNSPDDLKMQNSGFERWGGWQGVQLLLAGDRLIYGAPGSAVLTALNVSTGEIDWQVPRGRIQHLAGSDGKGLLLAIARYQALGINLTSGQTLWEIEIPEPAGQGWFDGTSYLFPILEHDYARIHLANRALSLSFPAEARTPHPDGTLPRKIRSRQLVVAGGAGYSVALDGIRKVQSPGQAIAGTGSDSVRNGLIIQAERGEWEQLLTDWQQILQSSPPLDQHRVRETLRALLSIAARQGETSDHQTRLRAGVTELSQTPLERAAWRQMQARDALQNRNWLRFVESWLTTPREELETLLPGESGGSRCRLDRWFQAAAMTVGTDSPQTAQTFRAVLQQQLERMAPDDAVEAHRLLLCLGTDPAGTQQAFRITEDPEDLQDRITWQLRWIALTQDASSVTAAGAIERLLQTSVKRESWPDARAWLHRLQEYPGDLKLPSGQTVSAAAEAWASTIMAAPNPSFTDDWPHPEPRLTRKTGRTKEVHLMPIPVHRGSGEAFSRLNLEVDYPGYEAIRFNGAESKRPWYQRLPRTNRNLRQETGLDHAWTFGDFCVLQAGSELFGISPQEKDNPRNSVLLWPGRDQSIDTLGSRENLMLSSGWISLKARPGFETASMARVDEFGHYNAAIGPVRPDYLCLQQMGMLVLLQTSTGQELWRRYDLPAQALVCGNASEVIVIAPLEQTITHYRALDGVELARNPWTHSLSDLLLVEGTRLLLELGPPELQEGKPHTQPQSPPAHPLVLQQLDVSSNKIIWQREWASGSIPFECDQQMIGVYQPAGEVEFIDIATGRVVGTCLIPARNIPRRIVASVSERDVLLVFSTEQTSEPVPVELAIRGGYRHPFVEGTACCIERGTAKLLWQTELPLAVLRLDQPVDLPVFITLAKAAPVRLEPTQPPAAPMKPDGEAPPEAPVTPGEPETPSPSGSRPSPDEAGAVLATTGIVLRCYDRRTGKLLEELAGERPYYSVRGEAARHLVTLDTLKTRLEIDFSEPVKESAVSRNGKGAASIPPKR